MAIRPRLSKRRNLQKDERGATMLEFGLIAPAFLLLVLFILQFSVQILTQALLAAGTSVASRAVEIGTISGAQSGGTDGQFRTLMCQYAGIIAHSCSTATIKTAAGTNFASIVGSSGNGQYGTQNQAVIITVTYQMNYFVPLIGKILGSPNGASLVVKNAIWTEP